MCRDCDCDPLNQCQGCQAGWPRKWTGSRTNKAAGFHYHPVVGGYKGEMVVCTRDRYTKEKP